jgi:exodeoxyribonuclease V alpha subunit
VRLRHSFRAERSLVAINEAVRGGDASAFVQAWRAGGFGAIERGVRDPRALALKVRDWADSIARSAARPTVADDDTRTEVVLSALRALAARQLLCALRGGDFGSLAVNAAIEHRLRQVWRVSESAPWYPGRAVMIVRNDYDTRLFNGDVGLCLADSEGALRVWFECSDDAGGTSVRGLATNALPPHEGAFAITVHKSQGSEYGRVGIVLPPEAGNRVLSRQLLYTGLSRARHDVELWSTERALEAALQRPVRRAGGLAARLRG